MASRIASQAPILTMGCLTSDTVHIPRKMRGIIFFIWTKQRSNTSMKIIFSRKGFDSGTGKVASPILPSGKLCSLPIPETLACANPLRYQDILFDGQSLGMLVHDLTRGKISPGTPAHLDPDLNSASVPRLPDWKPIFGQAGAAESHLQHQNI